MKKLGYQVQQIKTNTIEKIYLELTDRCNLKCSICYRKGWDVPPRDMEMSVFNKFLKDVQTIQGLETIVLGGIGEPTYHNHILEILENLKGYKLHMTTNGTLLWGALLEKMIETVHTITVSVDGMQEKFKEIRGIDLNAITDNLKCLEKQKKKINSAYPKVELQIVISKDNIDDIHQIVALASELNCDRLIISNLVPQGEDHRDQILYGIYPTEETKKLMTKIRNDALRKGLNIHIPAMALKTERSCDFIEDVTTYIKATGEVTPCYRLSHDGDEYVFGRNKKVKKYSFGNIMDTSLLEIWNHKLYHQFRYILHNNLYPSCIDCDLVEGCELPRESEDCYGNTISCSDCLWGRKYVTCP